MRGRVLERDFFIIAESRVWWKVKRSGRKANGQGEIRMSNNISGWGHIGQDLGEEEAPQQPEQIPSALYGAVPHLEGFASTESQPSQAPPLPPAPSAAQTRSAVLPRSRQRPPLSQQQRLQSSQPSSQPPTQQDLQAQHAALTRQLAEMEQQQTQQFQHLRDELLPVSNALKSVNGQLATREALGKAEAHLSQSEQSLHYVSGSSALMGALGDFVPDRDAVARHAALLEQVNTLRSQLTDQPHNVLKDQHNRLNQQKARRAQRFEDLKASSRQQQQQVQQQLSNLEARLQPSQQPAVEPNPQLLPPPIDTTQGSSSHRNTASTRDSRRYSPYPRLSHPNPATVGPAALQASGSTAAAEVHYVSEEGVAVTVYVPASPQDRETMQRLGGYQRGQDAEGEKYLITPQSVAYKIKGRGQTMKYSQAASEAFQDLANIASNAGIMTGTVSRLFGMTMTWLKDRTKG
jgi:hypothetical protein